jgi:predicted molibdopterin-dependent oxidoreductase YjgC
MKITIDARVLEANPGQTVLEVATANGIYIPSLCFHPRTGKAGRCRACVVEIEGVRGLKESCALEVSDGMVVNTQTEAVIAARKMVVELHLADGHHNCIACESNGKCELQDMAYSLGIERPAIQMDVEPTPVDDSSEGIIRDNDKCIQCGRCVAACNNNVVNEVLDFGWRASGSAVICDDDLPMGESTCVQCGECVQVCPVGALTYKQIKGKNRAWETEATRVTCPYCGVGCQIDLHTKDNKYVYAEAREKDWEKLPNRGMLCVKGRFGLDFCQAPDRLKKPMIRKKKGGKLTECEWDEAITFVADKLQKTRKKHGADSIGFFASAKVSNEENYQIMRFARGVIGTHNIDHCARL